MSFIYRFFILLSLVLQPLPPAMGRLSSGYVYAGESTGQVNDFSHHVPLHRERVLILALQLLRLYPNEFPGIDEGLCRRFLDLHDLAKLSETFASLLEQKFGLQMESNSPLVKGLNRTLADWIHGSADGGRARGGLRRSGQR